MPAADHIHSPTPEEVMEYLDGEGSVAARTAIEAHLTGCATCQSIAADLRGVSDQARTWRVDPAPAGLHAPAIPSDVRRQTRLLHFPWRVPRAAVVVVGAAAVVLLLVRVPLRNQITTDLVVPKPEAVDSRSAGRAPVIDALGGVRGHVSGRAEISPAAPVPDRQATISEAAQAVSTPHTPMVIRTASLNLVAKDFTAARPEVESIVASVNGFIDQMTVVGDTGSARQLRATLRVPGDRMADTLMRLRQLGTVIEDTQGSEDVTDQIVDLDARLANARATEQRLADILKNRTGKLSDVLEVERELARVRLDIERLAAEKANLGRRVTYATIGLTISEEHKASIDGPVSLATRIRLAFLDGIENAFDTAAFVLLLALRAGPSLLLWTALAGSIWIVVRRFRDSPKPKASE